MVSFSYSRPLKKLRAMLLAAALLPLPAMPQASSQQEFTLRASTEIVLVNLTAHDKNGALVRDLKSEDITILEDSKPQNIISLDVENTDAIVNSEAPQTRLLNNLAPAAAAQAQAVSSELFKDRRLIVLFFDLSSMQPDETDRAANAALQYVTKQMAPADLVAVVSLGSSLQVNQEFTADHELLKKALQGLGATGGAGFEEGTAGTTEGTPDTGQAFTADDTEYNIFNTDRRLQALRSIAGSLSRVSLKKSLLYFSSGMDRTGIENQSQLRSAINAAVRANLAIYTVDIRGLQAITPGGDATQASLRGVAAYSGRATLNALDANFSSQETLVTLAGDTGGKAFLDTNDFRPAFSRLQEDTSLYYLLAYHSTNPARDGRYRRITVHVNRPGLSLEYRHGYYAPADFQHSTQEDRENQLQEQLESDLPSTDFPVYLSTAYFRLTDNKFYVPVSLVVPGREIPFTRASDQDRATLDVLGVVEDQAKHPFGTLRDTVKLNLNASQEVKRKNVQYDNGFLLPPGSYHLKFVVRENQTGRMGSFETDITVPDLKNVPVKTSSVVLASQKQSAKPKKDNPLVRDGSELIPSVTHVFSAAQHLYLYYEVYDPAQQSERPTPSGAAPQTALKSHAGIRVLTNVAFFKGNVKAYETPLLEADEVNIPGRHATSFELDVPLTSLKPGFYTCQINIIDDASAHFVFPRLALLVR